VTGGIEMRPSATTAPVPVPSRGPGDRRPRFSNELLRPFALITLVAVTAVQMWTDWNRLTAPPLTVGLFCVVGGIALTLMALRTRPPQWALPGLTFGYGVLSAVLLPLAQVTPAPAFGFLASVVAGERLASRRADRGDQHRGAGGRVDPGGDREDAHQQPLRQGRIPHPRRRGPLRAQPPRSADSSHAARGAGIPHRGNGARGVSGVCGGPRSRPEPRRIWRPLRRRPL
jgi:hypothetical protein